MKCDDFYEWFKITTDCGCENEIKVKDVGKVRDCTLQIFKRDMSRTTCPFCEKRENGQYKVVRVLTVQFPGEEPISLDSPT